MRGAARCRRLAMFKGHRCWGMLVAFACTLLLGNAHCLWACMALDLSVNAATEKPYSHCPSHSRTTPSECRTCGGHYLIIGDGKDTPSPHLHSGRFSSLSQFMPAVLPPQVTAHSP